jgi:polysaccharide export outer membrane protein
MSLVELMGSGRLLLALLLLATAGGCAGTPSSQRPLPPPIAASDLDSLAYAHATVGLKAAAAPAAAEARVAPVASNVAKSAAGSSAFAQVLPDLPNVEESYRLDSGDRLRVVVFGQEGLTNSYLVDPSGMITMPLISAVKARGLTTAQLCQAVAERLRGGFIREPHVAIEVEIYRPFFILGEVTFPGQYAFVPHMTAQNAIAIAGGFTPRAYKQTIKLERPAPGGVVAVEVPLHTLMRPGDTIVVTERWF